MCRKPFSCITKAAAPTSQNKYFSSLSVESGSLLVPCKKKINPEASQTKKRWRCSRPPLVAPQGSEEERISVETASRYGSKPNVYSAAMAEDVSVDVKMDGDGPRMGADAKLSILVKNLSSSPRRTTLHSQVAVMYYTGVLKGTIKKEQLPVELLANEGWLMPC